MRTTTGQGTQPVVGSARVEHPVVQLIRDRLACSSKPGKRNDPYKLGLAIEGGGMRGVVSCGMASGLAFLGLTNTVDAVYGSSAGALNGSFLVSGKMPLGPTVFYDDINNDKFISWLRIFTNSPVMDLGFLIDHVLVNIKPLNWREVLDSPIPLKVVTSSLTRGKSRLLEGFGNKESLFSALRASATMPIVAGPPISYEGDRLVDASLFESLPHESAISDGCTHVLLLASRPKGSLRKPPSKVERFLIYERLKAMSEAAGDAFLHRAEVYNSAIQRIEESSANARGEPFIFAIQPSSNDREVSQLERNRDTLVCGTESGISAVMKVFVPEQAIRCVEILTPIDQFGITPSMTPKCDA